MDTNIGRVYARSCFEEILIRDALSNVRQLHLWILISDL